MTTIRLLDARRGLYRKCEELFGNAKIAEAIYRFLCDGIEECEDAEPERKVGKWINCVNSDHWKCNQCGCRAGFWFNEENSSGWEKDMSEWLSAFCPNCGAEMRGEDDG